MRIINVFFILLFTFLVSGCKGRSENTQVYSVSDSLPGVLADNHSDIIYEGMRYEAALTFARHILPYTPDDLIKFRTGLRTKIIEKAGIITDHDLPLDVREKGSVKMKGYSVKNLTFQTRPGVYATANLYMPDGNGPFPGVINMLGHWRKGKIETSGPQAVGHSLASNGYVCLTIDPWGAGERTSVHGDFEYHGANLGASLMNIGETLLGVQVSDNMRGVDLLCSLSKVDPKRIGATGASGGGNQTMWLSAVDERIKASVPVVSVGTFESYIMRSNCICELLPDGLTFTEESGVLFLANAPMMINHTKDDNPTFFPSEMLRSYSNARKAFIASGLGNNIAYRLFDLPHGYMTEDREAMLGWFNLHLKNEGDGLSVKEVPFAQLPEEAMMVFAAGQRDKDVVSTDQYCIKRGLELKEKFMISGSIDAGKKREELKEMLRLNNALAVNEIKRLSEKSGWEILTIETNENSLIPVLLMQPEGKEKVFTIVCSSDGKKSIPLSLIDEYKKNGEGVVIIDLKGVGEQTSISSLSYDYNGKLHTLARAELWMGRTILGDWVRELELVTRFLTSEMKAVKVSIDGSKEAGLAGLFLAATNGKIDKVTLRQAPVSYLFDKREGIDFYSMGIHIPGFLVWGDVSLAAALTGKDITFIDPLTISGSKPDEEQLRIYREEYAKVRYMTKVDGRTEFK